MPASRSAASARARLPRADDPSRPPPPAAVRAPAVRDGAPRPWCGISRALRTSASRRQDVASAGRRPPGGAGPGADASAHRERRVVGPRGAPPTPMASNPARSQCTYSRAGAPEIQRERPSASAIRPSRVVASLSATIGPRLDSRSEWRNAAFCARGLVGQQPQLDLDAGLPQPVGAARRHRVGIGSAATTRRIPAADDRLGARRLLALVRAGLQGDHQWSPLAPVARGRPAPTASACAPPYSACQPSPTGSPPSTTAPTSGLGCTRPQPRQARSRARAIAVRSFTRLEAHSQAEPREELLPGGIEVLEIGDELLVLAEPDSRPRATSSASPKPRPALTKPHVPGSCRSARSARRADAP